jgi:hypothetical protein
MADESYLYYKDKVHELRLFGKIWDSHLTWKGENKVLKDVISELGLEPLEEWYCILAYGSNACPAQLKHKSFEAVVVVKCRMFDVLPVYAGFESRFKYIPATLARAPGEEVETWVTLLRPSDLKEMDRSEGRPKTYDLYEVTEGRLYTENGKEIRPIYAYVTTDKNGLYLHGGKIIPLEPDQHRILKWFKAKKLVNSKTSDWLTVKPLDGELKRFGQMI